MNRAAKRLSNLVGLTRRNKPPVGQTPADVVFTENKWRLMRYRPRRAGLAYATPLLLVPSLINRHYVLDLMPGKSFAEYLVDQGHDVWIIDWGTPSDEDRYLGFDAYCERYLHHAVRQVVRRTGQERVHLLGYCLGGTLTTIYLAHHQEHAGGHIALAAPVNFHDDGLLSRWTRTPTFDLGAIVAACGNVPWQLMQSAFHLLKPTLQMNKAVYAIDRAWDDAFLDGFLAIETWANDNVSFPGEAYREYVQRLYRDNALIQGDYAVDGRPTRLSAIENPTLTIAFEHDHIVPCDSAAVLDDCISSPDSTVWRLPGGHVGAVVSRKAKEHLWPRLSSWLADRDAATTDSRTTAVQAAG